MRKKLILVLFFISLPLYAMHEHRGAIVSDFDRIASAIECGGLPGLRAELKAVQDERGTALDVTELVNRAVGCIYDRWYASRRLLPVALCLGGGVPLLDFSCGVGACLMSGCCFALSKDYEQQSAFFEKITLLLCTAQGVTFDHIRLTPQAREFVLLIEQKNK